jgi:hypothetical protein
MFPAPSVRYPARGHTTACLLLLAILVATPVQAAAGDREIQHETEPAAFSIGWLEPLGINIVDLVGLVPDSFLAGSIISYTPGYGIVRYESGKRSGNAVTITAKAYPRFVTDRGWSGSMFGCLGQGARIDQLGSATPPSKLRVYYQGKDVTREVSLVSHVPAGKRQPILNPKESEAQNRYRYPETDYVAATFTGDNQLILPGNMGCELIISMRDYRELTLAFSVEARQEINVTVVGKESFAFHSYLGPGFTGHLRSLANQLYAAGYGQRSERFDMHVPSDADYFILNFPPSPADPYTAFQENPLGNLDRSVGGTYRISIPNGLSVDHVNTMGLPLKGHWQDVDQADGTWLSYVNRGVQLSAPEYFVPAGVGYHPCMNSGGCSSDLLRQVYHTTMSMQVAYLRVERASTALERLPVQMVGSGYRALSPAWEETSVPHASPVASRHRILVPSVSLQRPAPPQDDASGCSWQGGCGWFTADGRMVDYIPRP